MHRKERLSAADIALLVVCCGFSLLNLSLLYPVICLILIFCVLTLQTCLKALTGAVSCIDVKHHKSLLAAVSNKPFH